MLPQRSIPLRRAVALLAALFLAAVLPASAQPPTEQKPVPGLAVQGQAEITITRLYASQFKAAKGDKAAARELAQELLTQGKATHDDYKLRFMALKLASEQAVVAGDHALALEAIGELAASFQMDTIDLKAGIYAQIEKTLTDKNEAIALTQTLLNLVDEALAGDNFAGAAKLLDVAKKTILKGEKGAGAAQVEKRGKEILEAMKAFKAIQPLLAKVGQDDKATLEVARYYCFIKGNYAKGLPLLAKCADKTLKELAERDLAGPKDAYTQALLADAWIEMGRAEKGLVQRQIYRRASHWYQAALPQLEGLTRVRVQREVDDLGKQFSVATVLSTPVHSAEITREVLTIAGVPFNTLALAISRDGKWIVSAGIGSDFSLWDVSTGQKVKDIGGQNNDLIYCIAISPDKKYALTGGTNNQPGVGGQGLVRLWNLQTGQQVRQFDGHNGLVRGVHFLPDGKRVITAGSDGSLRIFDLNNGKLLQTLTANQGGLSALAISKDGRRAVSGGTDSKVIVWDLQTGRQVRQFEHPRVIRAVALTPDGKFAVSNSTGGQVKVWDVEGGKELRTLPTAASVWMALSPDGRRVYAVSSLAFGKKGGGVNPNTGIQVFDLHTGRELRQLTGHNGAVRALAASPDGRWLVSVGADGMRVWGAK